MPASQWRLKRVSKPAIDAFAISTAFSSSSVWRSAGSASPGDPGSLVNVAGVGITEPAAINPNAAEFVAWLLTPATQQWFAENTFEYPLIEGIAVADGLPALDTLTGPDVALADLADLPGTLEMLTEVGLL